jgi:hypothetical protein
MFDWITHGLGSLFGFVGGAASSVAGWAWDKVTGGIYTWLAKGLALLIEWVWGVLDQTTTPRLDAPWYVHSIAKPIELLALSVTVALMLASAIQAALAGRPEQIGDAVKEGARVIVASALTIAVIDALLGVTDAASNSLWATGRPDLVEMIEKVTTVAATSGPLSQTFVGPLCLLVGFVGLLGLVVTLMMRSALLYVAAGLAPLVWSSSILPMFRTSSRKLVHLLVALIFSKLAIVVTLLVSVALIAHTGDSTGGTSVVNDGAQAVGTLMSGFICFLVASASPFVLYRLMPTVEGAVVGAGVAGGWGRSATNAAQAALMVKSAGASTAASAATRTVAGQSTPGTAVGRESTGGRAGTSPLATQGVSGAARAADSATRPDQSGSTGTGNPKPGGAAPGSQPQAMPVGGPPPVGERSSHPLPSPSPHRAPVPAGDQSEEES